MGAANYKNQSINAAAYSQRLILVKWGFFFPPILKWADQQNYKT